MRRHMLVENIVSSSSFTIVIDNAMFIFSAEASSSSLDAPQNGGRVFAMRHGVKKARLGRPADQRKALVRGLVTEVLRHGKITTTKVC
jgi:hypothetical protein